MATIIVIMVGGDIKFSMGGRRSFKGHRPLTSLLNAYFITVPMIFLNHFFFRRFFLLSILLCLWLTTSSLRCSFVKQTKAYDIQSFGIGIFPHPSFSFSFFFFFCKRNLVSLFLDLKTISLKEHYFHCKLFFYK